MRLPLPMMSFVFVLFLMGTLFGGLIVFALSIEQHQELSRYTGSFLQLAAEGQLQEWQKSFWTAYGAHVKWIGLTWLFGISVIGLPLVIALNFVKGALVGFAITYLGTQLSWKGLLLALVAILPSNLVMVPCLLIGSAVSLSFSLSFVRKRMTGMSMPQETAFRTFTLTSLALTVLVSLAAVIEVYLVPHGLRWLAPFFV